MLGVGQILSTISGTELVVTDASLELVQLTFIDPYLNATQGRVLETMASITKNYRLVESEAMRLVNGMGTEDCFNQHYIKDFL